MVFRNQRRYLLTYNAIGMDEFLQYREKKRMKYPDFDIEKKRYQKYFLDHGSKFLSTNDVQLIMDFSETKADMDIVADILSSICQYKYSRYY